MENKHILEVIRSEVQMDESQPVYYHTVREGLDTIKTAGAKLKAEVENVGERFHAGRVRAEAVRLIVVTIRFLKEQL